MPLYLSHLTLSHFRSHLRTRIALDARPVVLVGPNGSGKTNILEALSLLSPGRGMRRAGMDELARRPEDLGWKLIADVTTPSGPHHIETWAEPGQSRQVRIDSDAAPQTALGDLLRIVWLTPAMDRLWTDTAEGRRRFLDRMVLSFRPDHAQSSLGYEKAMRERNRLLRDGQGDAAWFDALEAQMAQAGARIMANRRAVLSRLIEAQGAGDDHFPAADLALTAPEGVQTPDDEDGLLRMFSEGRRRDMAAGRSLGGPHRVDLSAIWRAKSMPAAQCSTGEQKALLISLILANARAVAEDFGAPPILALDEVAAHLDDGRRAALYDALADLGAQAWMTGTGSELFAHLGARAQAFTLSDGPQGSQLNEVSL